MSQTQEADPTIHDVLTAINTFSTAVDKRFSNIEGDIKDIKVEVKHIKNAMVTKEYLDEKMSEQNGKLISLIRKEDHKVDTVTSLLHDHKLLSDNDIQQIDQVRLFPKTTAAT